ncbi:TetR/AcrR family transcriptional regulator [Alphaproteobacteria bacterium]|nr:TetR/AcrR family transcriptional regulator [Alphaproteobacteria bacterium]
MNTRTYQATVKQEKREAILDGSLKNFIKKGYANTSVADIALTSNVSLATLYKHYRAKEEIFEDAIHEAWERVEGAYKLPETKGLSLAGALTEVARHYIAFLHRRDVGKLMGVCLAPLGLPKPMGHLLYKSIIEPTRHHLEAIVTPHLPEDQVEMRVRLFLSALNDMLVWPLFTLGLKDIPATSVETVISYAVADICQKN